MAHCRHGWRGASEEQSICDPCPACGSKSLFIGNGGYLTCSSLRCPQPAVGREVMELQRRISASEDRERKWQRLHELMGMDWMEIDAEEEIIREWKELQRELLGVDDAG